MNSLIKHLKMHQYNVYYFTKIWSLNMETKQRSVDMYLTVSPYGVVNEFGD